MERSRLLVIVFASLALLAAVALAIVVAVRPGELFNRDLPKAIADYRAAGLPWTQSDLKLPSLLPGENGWDDLKEHAKRMSRTSRAQLRQKVDRLLDKRDIAGAQEVLSSFSKETAAARMASAKKGFRVHPDWGYGIWLEHDSQVEMFVLLLCLNSKLAALKGDFHGAQRLLTDAGNLSALGRQEAHLIGLLRHIVSETMIIDSALYVAYEMAKAKADLGAMAPFFERSVGFDLLPTVLRGEAYLDLSTIRNMPRQRELIAGRDKLDEEVAEEVERRILEGSPAKEDVTESVVVNKMLTAYLKQCVERAAIVRELPLDPISASSKYDALLEAQEDQMLLSGLTASIFASPLSGPAKAIVRQEARRRAHQSLFKVLSYRSKHGRWPKDLKGAGGENEDPFDRNAPMRSRFESNEIVVYSVGPNMRDDRGNSGKQQHRLMDDVSARLRR